MNEIAKSDARMAAPAVSKASYKPLAQCTSLGEAFQTLEFRERIAAAAPSHIKPGRLLQTFIGAVSKNPLLRECNVRSYIGACLTLSQTGFEANTALGHAYLIPFRETKWNPVTRKREPKGVNINVIFGYPGLIDLSYRTGLVRNIHPDVVFPGDEFSFEYGSNAHLKHIPRQRRDGDMPLYAYMHAALKDGQAFEVIPYGDVLAIRNKTQAYRYALEAKQQAESEGKRLPMAWTEAPWVAHEFPMARKTAVRAGSKWLPRSVELHSAIALEDAQERGRGIDFGNVMDAPTIDGSPDYLSAAVESEVEDDTPVDPGIAHGIRSSTNTVQTNATDAEAARKRLAAEQAELAKVAAAKRAAPPPPDSGFEAVLIDVHGDPTDAMFIDPADFARAFMALWRDAGDRRDALREYNADAVEDVRRDPTAWPLLVEMDEADSDVAGAAEDGPTGGEVEQPVVMVEPPQDRGKPSWPAYTKAMKAALAENARTAPRFLDWLMAQRPTLELCPPAQRVLIVRAIMDTAQRFGIDAMPAWLSGLIRPAASAESKPAEDAAPGGVAVSADERWVDQQIASLADIKERAAFDALLGSTALKTIMARLRRENKPLFDKADEAFSAKFNALDAGDA